MQTNSLGGQLTGMRSLSSSSFWIHSGGVHSGGVKTTSMTNTTVPLLPVICTSSIRFSSTTFEQQRMFQVVCVFVVDTELAQLSSASRLFVMITLRCAAQSILARIIDFAVVVVLLSARLSPRVPRIIIRTRILVSRWQSMDGMGMDLKINAHHCASHKSVIKSCLCPRAVVVVVRVQIGTRVKG